MLLGPADKTMAKDELARYALLEAEATARAKAERKAPIRRSTGRR
jgi:hypothetical protein